MHNEFHNNILQFTSSLNLLRVCISENIESGGVSIAKWKVAAISEMCSMNSVVPSTKWLMHAQRNDWLPDVQGGGAVEGGWQAFT